MRVGLTHPLEHGDQNGLHSKGKESTYTLITQPFPQADKHYTKRVSGAYISSSGRKRAQSGYPVPLALWVPSWEVHLGLPSWGLRGESTRLKLEIIL